LTREERLNLVKKKLAVQIRRKLNQSVDNQSEIKQQKPIEYKSPIKQNLEISQQTASPPKKIKIKLSQSVLAKIK